MGDMTNLILHLQENALEILQTTYPEISIGDEMRATISGEPFPNIIGINRNHHKFELELIRRKRYLRRHKLEIAKPS